MPPGSLALDLEIMEGMPGAEHGKLLMAAISKPHPKNADLVRVLLRFGADPNEPNGKPLRWAVHSHQPEVVEALLTAPDAERLKLEAWTAKDARTALHFAALQGCVRSMAALLQAGADANAADCDGKTALHLLTTAALEGIPEESVEECCQLLLAYGADTSATDRNDYTPLDRASGFAVPSIVRALLAHGGKNKLRQALARHGKGGFQPLHLAVGGASMIVPPPPAATRVHERLEVVAMILKTGLVDLEAKVRNNQSQTALHLACLDANPDMVKLLLANKADPLSTTDTQEHPIHSAIGMIRRRAQAVACLEPLVEASGPAILRSRANINTPLGLAVTCRNMLAAQELLRLGAAVTQGCGSMKRTPLHMACNYLTRSEDANGDGQPMYCDTEYPNLEAAKKALQLPMVQLLLANGADPNIASVNKPGKQSIKRGGSSNSSIAVFGEKGSLGETPLDNAVVAGTTRVVAALVGAGADPTLTGSFSLLTCSIRQEPKKLKALLASPKVDINAVLEPTGTLLFWACELAAVECVEVLLEAGADPTKPYSGLEPLEIARAGNPKRPASAWVGAKSVGVSTERRELTAHLIAEALRKRVAPAAPAPGTHTCLHTARAPA